VKNLNPKNFQQYCFLLRTLFNLISKDQSLDVRTLLNLVSKDQSLDVRTLFNIVSKDQSLDVSKKNNIFFEFYYP